MPSICLREIKLRPSRIISIIDDKWSYDRVNLLIWPAERDIECTQARMVKW
jgi:hypothetical protein